MGWLWPSSSQESTHNSSNDVPAPQTEPEQPTSTLALTDEQRVRIFGRASPSDSSQPQTRDQKADSELEAFIQSFQEEASSKPHRTSTSPFPRAQEEPTTSLPAPPSRILPDGSLDISPAATLPRTMSCRAQFDQAFYCQSLGGKFNDVYRYGHLRSCSEQWGAFWFCMRTRTLPEHEKEERIREFYESRDKRRVEERGGSSEDIWELRTRGVRRAFDRDPDGDEIEDGKFVKQ